MTTDAPQVQRTEIGPPHEDPLAARTDLPPVEPLMLDGVTLVDRPVGPAGELEGAARFADPGLVGPPGRLQGGLHPYARLYAPFRKLAPTARPGPLAMVLRLGAPITLGEDVHFRGRYLPRGRAHWLVTRFSGTPRLDGVLTTLPRFDTTPPAGLRETIEPLWAAPEFRRRVLSLEHVARGGWFGVRIHPARDWQALPGMRRFATSETTVGTAFAGFYLDTTAILSQAVQLRNPLFTTRYAIELNGDAFAADESWLFVAHREPVHWPDLGVPLPTRIQGRVERTRTVRAWMIRERDLTVHARAWVTGHPVDLERLLRLRARAAPAPAGGPTPSLR